MKEGWHLEVLHRLQVTKCPHKERFLSITQVSRHRRVPGWSSATSPPWTSRLVFGKLRCLRSLANTRHLRSAVWVCTNSYACHMASVMPQATFQHLMQNCLGELNLSFAMVYLEDVIMYSKMPEDHLTWLQAIFDHFAHHGLKLKPSKCHFFKEEISYLGHEISAKGMLPRQKGIEEITCMGPPMTYTGIRKFIGAVGYFRRFIKNLV